MSLNEGGSTTIDNGGPSMSEAEEAFFTSGGESEIPSEGGADAGATVDGGAGGADAGAAKQPDASAKTNDAPKGDHVPLATFLEEKRQRKELVTKFQDAEKQLAELRGKFSIIDRLKIGGEDPATQQPAGPPSVEDDIFGAVKHVTGKIEAIEKSAADAKAAQEANDKAAADHKTFVDNYRADAASFEVKTPDFKPAYDFLLNSRAAELKAIGYDTPESLHAALLADEMAIAQMAFEKGKSPSQMLYDLSVQRGYKKAAPTQAEIDGGKAAQKLDTIERGQAANKSLSNAGGSAGDQDVTGEQLAAMSLEEFEAWSEKNPAKAKRLFGG